MDVFLSLFLGLALMMSSCFGSHEEESTSEFSEYSNETTTAYYDYDYNATFEYYYVTVNVESVESVGNKAAGIGPGMLVLLLGLAVHQIWNR